MHPLTWMAILSFVQSAAFAVAAGPTNRPTTLADPSVEFTVPDEPYVVVSRVGVRLVIADNQAADSDVLPGHRPGYSGVASLTHRSNPRNLFVPLYAGLNFEHIHDGTVQPRDILFEPRRVPNQLRVIDSYTVELYQPPTPHWGLESTQRFHLREDGTIHWTFECIPRRDTFANGYIGLFWASYIHEPESLDIHFRGHEADEAGSARWLRGVTPSHGENAAHLAAADNRHFPRDDNFPLTLVFNRSRLRYSDPWYFGICREMAYALIFPPAAKVRFSQSPTGGGQGNPAWDFQLFIPDYVIGKRYRFDARALYLPYQSHDAVLQAVGPHLDELGNHAPRPAGSTDSPSR